MYNTDIWRVLESSLLCRKHVIFSRCNARTCLLVLCKVLFCPEFANWSYAQFLNYGTPCFNTTGHGLDTRSSTNQFEHQWSNENGSSFANGLKWDYWLYKRNHNFLYSIIANISGRGQWDHQDHIHRFPQPLEMSGYFPGFNSIS